MKKGLVSVVLPIYGVEKYLDRCMRSVINQTYKDLEIIMVDDGSKDSCPQICDNWVQRDSRVKVIHKENAGLGMARNTGIEVATGEYILFVDSDDYIALDTIEKVMNVAARTKAELIQFGHCDVDRNGNTKRIRIPDVDKELFEDSEVIDIILPNMIAADPVGGKDMNLWMSACMSAYSYSLIHRKEWRFVSERDLISEDVYSLLCLLKDVRSVAIIEEALYFYCENGSSLTHTYRKDRFLKLKHFYDACQIKCDELKYNDVIKERLNHEHMSNVIGAMKLIVTSELPSATKKHYIYEIVNDVQIQNIVRRMRIHNEKMNRKLLFESIRHKQTRLVYLMLLAKAK